METTLRPALRAVVCLFGVVSRSLNVTWPAINRSLSHLSRAGFAIELHIFHLDVGREQLVDGCTLREEDILQAARYPAQLHTTSQALVDEAISAKCTRQGHACRIANPWYTEAQLDNALRQQHSEWRVGSFLQHSEADVALVLSADLFLATLVNVTDMRTAASEADVVYFTDNNNGVNGTGVTNSFYLGRPRALARLLRQFEELPHNLKPPDGVMIDDYENVLRRRLERQRLHRRHTSMCFFKVRANGRYVWQGEVSRFMGLPIETRKLVRRTLGGLGFKVLGKPFLPRWIEGATDEERIRMLESLRVITNFSAPVCHHKSDKMGAEQSFSFDGLCGQLRSPLIAHLQCGERATPLGSHKSRRSLSSALNATLIISVPPLRFLSNGSAGSHAAEIVEALRTNTGNPHLITIRVLVDEEPFSADGGGEKDVVTTEALRALLQVRFVRAQKVSAVSVPTQPGYHRILSYASRMELQGRLVIIANADVVFDETLERIDPFSHRAQPELAPLVSVLSVTHISGSKCEDEFAGCPRNAHIRGRRVARRYLRREKAKGIVAFGFSTGLPDNRFWSADAFLFRSPLPLSTEGVRILTTPPTDANFVSRGAFEVNMNMPGAENRFMAALNASGARLENICRAVNLGHLHCAPKMHAVAKDAKGRGQEVSLDHSHHEMWYEPLMCNPVGTANACPVGWRCPTCTGLLPTQRHDS